MSKDALKQPVVKPKAGVEAQNFGEVALVSVNGLVDEHFQGFGAFGDGTRSIVLNVTGMTRMTSFGVRQWLKGMDAIPKTVTDLYLLGCPTFFVDQLNMVLNFGGQAQILSVIAPYTCPSCGVESGEMIDVLADRAGLAKGATPDKECARCGGHLEFDETPESYFSFASKYAALSVQPAVAQMLSSQGLFTAVELDNEKPPRIIKLVHGVVTYFRIIGNVGSMFRARPFLVGAEGEVVIDLAEVGQFDALGQNEWRRVLKTLSGQVPALTIVDIDESFLTVAGDSIAIARNIAIWSARIPYVCNDCGRKSTHSFVLDGAAYPFSFEEHVCSTCGGSTRSVLDVERLAPVQKASNNPPVASAKVIRQREEILSRALTDANVAQAGEGATAQLAADDTILGKYKIVRRLSEGGMAEVFLAKQVGIGGFEKPVALKRIQRQLLETRHLAIDMFLNEAKIAGRLMHPNIVQVLDVGEVSGALYLAMEFVRGKDLRDVIKEMRNRQVMMPLGDACAIVREVAQALHHAYWSTDMAGNRLAVVHRDVSPHNVILSFDGAVKLLDFGVAMSAVTEQNETMIVGKSMYMSPEHTTNHNVDHRSDLFSLGVVLYLLCTGAMPFSGADPRETFRKIRSGAFTPPENIVQDLPPGLAALISRMLNPNPELRPQTGRDVVAALTAIAQDANFQSSPTTISEFIGDLFPAERDESAPIETRAPRTSGQIAVPRRPSGANRVSTTLLEAPAPTPPEVDYGGTVIAPPSFEPHVFPTGSNTSPAVADPRLPRTTGPQKNATYDIPRLTGTSPALKNVVLIIAAILIAIVAFLIVRPG
jgi:serine/threonine protein kinase